MKFRCGMWILWLTLACTTAPNVEQSATPPALSFVILNSPTGVYELEDTPALIWRNNDEQLTNTAFYFSHMMFACSELSGKLRAIENESTTKSLAFISSVLEPQQVRNLETHPVFCEKKKRYNPSAVPIIRKNDRYIINPENEGNPERQEFSIGYEIAEDCIKLNARSLPPMERFENLAAGSGWLEAFKVVYDIKNFIARQASYELNFLGVSETAPGNCKKFDVGKVQNFFGEIRFISAYKRSHQIGTGGSLSDVIRPKRPQSQSVNRPSSSAQNEQFELDGSKFKKPYVITQPQESQPTEDESQDHDEIDFIDNKPIPWDHEEYSCMKDLITFNTSYTSISSSQNTETLSREDSSKSKKRSRGSSIVFDEPPDEEYMVMQQLAPIEYFDVFSIQWSTCTYLNVAPMWLSLANGPWKNVDQAIRRTLFVIDKLSIIAGTYGQLALPKRNSNEYQNVYLRSNNMHITVPLLFYKFVVYKVPVSGSSVISLLYAIIIVMHNNFGVPTKRICPKDPVDLCSQYGWDVGSNNEIATPYCCKPSNKTLELLEITYPSPINNLDLNKVVVEVTNTFEFEVKNYNQFHHDQYEVIAKKKAKTKKLNDIYF